MYLEYRWRWQRACVASWVPTPLHLTLLSAQSLNININWKGSQNININLKESQNINTIASAFIWHYGASFRPRLRIRRSHIKSRMDESQSTFAAVCDAAADELFISNFFFSKTFWVILFNFAAWQRAQTEYGNCCVWLLQILNIWAVTVPFPCFFFFFFSWLTVNIN